MTTIEREEVASSNLRTVGYDEESKMLVVEFVSGRIYHYFDVPWREYDALMEAPSHGIYFNQHVKGKYTYVRVR